MLAAMQSMERADALKPAERQRGRLPVSTPAEGKSNFRAVVAGHLHRFFELSLLGGYCFRLLCDFNLLP